MPVTFFSSRRKEHFDLIAIFESAYRLIGREKPCRECFEFGKHANGWVGGANILAAHPMNFRHDSAKWSDNGKAAKLGHLLPSAQVPAEADSPEL